jgi:hypothetical protein
LTRLVWRALKVAIPTRNFLDSVLRFLPLRRKSNRGPGTQHIVLHDPAAQKPKDLDNPFREAASQERVGDLIGRSYPDPKEKTEK